MPFDPKIARGEDIDFLINARMFGFPFFRDNQLSITHLPPPKTHPTWLQLRVDIYRFMYERAKIEHQKEIKGMKKVYPEDFDPYPGAFLKQWHIQAKERFVRVYGQLLKGEENNYSPDKVTPPGIFSKVLKLTPRGMVKK